ncbi:MAG: hypothetical protein C4576_12985 [Desulfobacteraceae bacterium]|nr:MAG: hypothetical protein C4576_12985 [Desulfobacteraceae bacterium]
MTGELSFFVIHAEAVFFSSFRQSLSRNQRKYFTELQSTKIDATVKSREMPLFVIPAKAGIQGF